MELPKISHLKKSHVLVQNISLPKLSNNKRLSEDNSYTKLPSVASMNKSISFVNSNGVFSKMKKQSLEHSYVYDAWSNHLATKPLRNEGKVKLQYLQIKRKNINPRMYADNVDILVNQKMYEGRLIRVINRLMC
ncbi:hypothetical protein SteCoe_27410 [Stentor coeruleus]|uniref:Uncharacterized protein n=1 Tax=Stentor coeruleus TaxID=5963 RepID=A0A1R2BAM4_9CILI|nr:hypothetical protein SteCoe_27410 [Stentor coeruleus]